MEEKLCIFTGHRTIPHSKYAALEQVLAQQITLLADLLRQSGLDIPLGVLNREELVAALMEIAG